MPVVDVVNLEGKKVGQLDLAEAVFGVKVNQHLLHEASRWYLRGLRRGTHKTKDKSEVSGAGQALETERHWTRAGGLHSFAALAPWRHRARAAPQGLQLRVAEKNDSRRVAFRAVRQAGG